MENKKLLAYFQLMRLPAVFTACSNVFAAQIIAMQGQTLWIDLALLMIASSCLYLGGMVLNDCFDYAEDKRERPHRPLPSGAIQRGHAWLLGFGLLGFGAFSAAFLGGTQLTLALCIILAILFYNGVAKSSSFLGAKSMASCRYLNWLFGLSVGILTLDLLLVPIPVALFIMAITLLSQQETTADNKRVVNYVMMLVLAVYASFIALQFLNVMHFKGSLFFTGIATYFVITKLIQLRNDYTPENIQKTMGLLIMCIIPLDALMLLSYNAYVGWALLVLLLLIPGKILGKKMYST